MALTPAGQYETEWKNTHLLHAERYEYKLYTPCLSHADSNTRAAAGVDHGEYIVIDGDENANDENSSDGEEDVGAGGGAGDEVIKLSRCVLAALVLIFGSGDTRVVVGGGSAHGSRAKNDVGL